MATANDFRTWTFDVCTNAWTLTPAAQHPVDPDSIDLGPSAGLPVSLSDRHSWPFRLVAFDPRADRYVAYLGDRCVGYWSADPPDDCPGDRTWLLDPGSGMWSEARAFTPDMVFGWESSGHEIAFDEATGRTVIFSDGRVIAYDVAADAWDILHTDPPFVPPDPWSVGPLARHGHVTVYDPDNARLVVMGGEMRTGSDPMWMPADDVWAFDTRTGEWTQLLAPSVPYPTPVAASPAP